MLNSDINQLDLSLLQRIRDRVAKHWTTQAYARDTWGKITGACDADACDWCLEGAYLKETDQKSNGSVLDKFCDMLRPYMPEKYKSCSRAYIFNDVSTQEQVLAVLDRAIAATPASQEETSPC